MKAELFLNELSHNPLAASVADAQARMRCLMQLVSEAIKFHCAKILRTHENINLSPLAPSYCLGQWRNDPSVGREERTLFNSLSFKTPHIEDIPDCERLNANSCDVLFAGNIGAGFTTAYVCDGLSVSLPSAQCWDSAGIPVEVRTLDINGEIETRNDILKHASNRSHVVMHGAWLNLRNAIILNDGRDLWVVRTVILKRLDFCPGLQPLIESIGQNHFCFQALLKKLRNLQEVAVNWNSGPFPHEKIEGKARPESQATMNKYADEREFLCSDGIKRTFCWHIHLPTTWRLYYEPNIDSHTIHIGYIGEHLKTVKFH